MTKKTVLFLGSTKLDLYGAISLVSETCVLIPISPPLTVILELGAILSLMKADPEQSGEVLAISNLPDLKASLHLADAIWIVDQAGCTIRKAKKINREIGLSEEDRMSRHEEPCLSCGKRAGFDALFVTGSSKVDPDTGYYDPYSATMQEFVVYQCHGCGHLIRR